MHISLIPKLHFETSELLEKISSLNAPSDGVDCKITTHSSPLHIPAIGMQLQIFLLRAGIHLRLPRDLFGQCDISNSEASRRLKSFCTFGLLNSLFWKLCNSHHKQKSGSVSRMTRGMCLGHSDHSGLSLPTSRHVT